MEHHDGQDRLMASFDYELGRSGKRLGVSESIDGATVEIDYTYDGLGRIVSAARSSGPDSDFAYDVAGNRLSRTRGGVETTYQYNALDQMEAETQAGTTTSYTYDDNGNLTAKTVAGQTINYSYDSRNRLTTVYHGEVLGLPDLEYAYDFSGNRVAKAERTGSDDFSRSQFLIDDNNLTGYPQTFLESNAETGSASRRYEYGDDLYSQVQWNGEGEGEIAFFLYDGLGTTRALCDSAGEFVQSYHYHPFGELIDEPQTLSTNHLFTGEYLDTDLDYYYLRARYYDPTAGRFTSHDPFEDNNNKLHKYAYCGNDGINKEDISGRMSGYELIGLIIVGIIIGILANILINTAYHRPLHPTSRPNAGIDMILRNRAYINKYADEVGINRYFLAGAVANETANRFPCEDEAALIEAIFIYPSAEKGVGIGHSYGIAQLHVFKARFSAREVYKQTDEWVLYSGEEDPPNPDHFINGNIRKENRILHANYDRWHVPIASALTGREEFSIKHAAGWAKLCSHLEDPIYGTPYNNGDYYGSLINLWLGHQDKGTNYTTINQDRIHYWMELIKKEKWLDE